MATVPITGARIPIPRGDVEIDIEKEIDKDVNIQEVNVNITINVDEDCDYSGNKADPTGGETGAGEPPDYW